MKRELATVGFTKKFRFPIEKKLAYFYLARLFLFYYKIENQ